MDESESIQASMLALKNLESLIICMKFWMYNFYNVGDWSNGMIGVSKTFGGSSILSSPALLKINIDSNHWFYWWKEIWMAILLELLNRR